jgi:asparagine synthase (glutamine-hydrolysing)
LRYKEKINYIKYTPKDTDFWEVANDYIALQEEPFHFVNAQLFQAYFRHAYQNDYRVMIIGAGGDELLNGYAHFYMPLLVYLRNHRQYGQLFKNVFMQYNSLKSYPLRKKVKTFFDLLQKNDNALPFTHSFSNPQGESVARPFLKKSSFSKIQVRQGHPKEYHQLSIGLMSNWLMNYWQRNSNKSHFGVPVEPRSPFLDYRIVELSMSLPPEHLYNSGWTKFILRKTVSPLIPSKVGWRRIKRGFPFNSDVWFLNSKERIIKNMNSVSHNPYVNTTRCISEYDTLSREDPTLLWRITNFCLWWKRIIEKEDILI